MSAPFARAKAPLCVVSLTYDAPLGEIDAAMGRHVTWLTDAYRNDLVIASGRKVPRTGGIIVMRGDKERVEALVATDPFVADGLATADVIPFTASMVAPVLADLVR